MHDMFECTTKTLADVNIPLIRLPPLDSRFGPPICARGGARSFLWRQQ